MLKEIVFVASLTMGGMVASAAEWSWQWPVSAGQAVPQAEVCHFQYGKEWAYAIEIDDGPTSMLSVIQPLLSQYKFTDAPPGITGGKALPFVGSGAIVVQSTGLDHPDLIQWDQLRKLKKLGWGIINHSYAHAGHGWAPEEKLTREQFRRDLFWSQTLIATELGTGRAPTHFVYPNGYLAYREYLAEFGLRSATHVAGEPVNWQLYSGKPDLYNLQRSYLDEGPWLGDWGKSDVLFWFPKDGPVADQMFIDFTHGINSDHQSNHYKLWAARMSNIASRFGKQGKDNMWSAPTGNILDYASAASAAKVKAEPGRLTVQLPDNIPGSRLTLKIKGIKAETLKVPEGAVCYRQGDTTWITTPMIGKPGSPAPTPNVKRIYSGEVKDIHWDTPIALAAVRLMQKSDPSVKNFSLQLNAVTPDGKTKSLVTPEEAKLPVGASMRWLVYCTIPNEPAVSTTDLHISKDKCLGKMEVWAIADEDLEKTLAAEEQAQRDAALKLIKARAYLFNFGSRDVKATAEVGIERPCTPVLAQDIFDASKGYGFDKPAMANEELTRDTNPAIERGAVRMGSGTPFRFQTAPGRYQLRLRAAPLEPGMQATIKGVIGGPKVVNVESESVVAEIDVEVGSEPVTVEFNKYLLLRWLTLVEKVQ